MATIGIPANERAEELRIAWRRPHVVDLVRHWCRLQFQCQRATFALPDDAREQLQSERLLAQHRLQRLSMTVRPPLW